MIIPLQRKTLRAVFAAGFGLADALNLLASAKPRERRQLLQEVEDYRRRLGKMNVGVRLLDAAGQEVAAEKATTVELRSTRVVRTAELEQLDDQGRRRLLGEMGPLGSARLLIPVAP